MIFNILGNFNFSIRIGVSFLSLKFLHVFGDRCNYETSMIETNTLCSYTTYFPLFLIARISCDPWNTKIIQETEDPLKKLCTESGIWNSKVKYFLSPYRMYSMDCKRNFRGHGTIFLSFLFGFYFLWADHEWAAS